MDGSKWIHNFFFVYVVLLKISLSFTKILIEQQVNPQYLSFASPLLVFILLQEHTNTIWSVENSKWISNTILSMNT